MRDVAVTVRNIESANRPEDVVSAVHAFIESLSPDEVANLPQGLVSLGSLHVQEISHAAVELAQQELLTLTQHESGSLLKDAATVFSRAAWRLAHLTVS